MTLLLKNAFVDAKTESSSFFMHPVFHRWCLHAFEKERTVKSRFALIVVLSPAPSVSMTDYSPTQRRLRPHRNRFLSLAQQRVQENFIVVVKYGVILDDRELQRQCYEDHGRGTLFLDQGKFKEAENMYLQTLARERKGLGAGNTLTISTLYHPGDVYSDQDKMQEAKEMYLRALAGFEKPWDAEDKHPLYTRYKLVELYYYKEQVKNAIEQLELVVRGYSWVFGPDHLDTVEALERLNVLKSDRPLTALSIKAATLPSRRDPLIKVLIRTKPMDTYILSRSSTILRHFNVRFKIFYTDSTSARPDPRNRFKPFCHRARLPIVYNYQCAKNSLFLFEHLGCGPATLPYLHINLLQAWLKAHILQV